MPRHLLVVLLLTYTLTGCSAIRPAPLPPGHLQTQYRERPLGLLPAEAPFFTWWVRDDRRDARQSAWQIQVGVDSAALAQGQNLFWDSGRREAGREVQVPYEGPTPQPLTRYYWRVRSWDQHGEASPFSGITWWETGPGEWRARWIGDGSEPPARPEDFYQDQPAPLLRKNFELAEKPASARLFISGLGYCEAYLNGEKTGAAVLDPGWTNYGKRVLYSTYDVTDLLQQGPNALGIMLGNGWYNPRPTRHFGRWNLREILTIGQPKVIAELHLAFADGRRQVIVSDTTWKHSSGWILFNDLYLGERQDGRRKPEGWLEPGFDDQDWKHTVVAPTPEGELVPQLQPAVEITARLPARRVTEPSPGVYVVDFGQNFAGWIRLRLTGQAGDSVRIRYGELLHDDGSVNGLTAVATQIKTYTGIKGGPGVPETAWQESTYLLRGEGEEFFQPHFTFHGFRYVQIWGYPGELTTADIEGLRLSANLEKDGTFSTNYEPFNRLQEVTEWTFLSNVFSIQSDCPGREKFGYGGDMVTAGEAFIYNYDMANFYRKTVQDFADDVRPNGGLPETAPYNGIDSEGLGEGSGPIGWQLAHPFLIDQLYRFYGDHQLMVVQYPVVKRLVDFLESKATNHRITIGLSDHAPVEGQEKPVALTSTLFYYHIVSLAARFAGILEQAEDQRRFEALAGNISKVLLEEEFNPATGCFASCNQSSQAIGLWYDLLPEAQADLALQQLEARVKQDAGGHLATGIFGTKMLLDVLRRHDRADLAYLVASQPDYPGWRFMLDRGATTLWEAWEDEDNIPSHNHPMFGSISEWFYRSVAGINPAPDAVGGDRWVLAPLLTEQVTEARGAYASIRGPVKSSYHLADGRLTWNFEIPANTTAEVRIPFSGLDNPLVKLDGQTVFEGGQLRSREGEVLRDAVVVNLGSGRYEVTVGSRQ